MCPIIILLASIRVKLVFLIFMHRHPVTFVYINLSTKCGQVVDKFTDFCVYVSGHLLGHLPILLVTKPFSAMLIRWRAFFGLFYLIHTWYGNLAHLHTV